MRSTTAALGIAMLALCATQTGAVEPPPPPTDVQGGGNLSDKLSTTNGVIHPNTDVDPDIKVTPPATGSSAMPVIPPPGTPGGDQAVKPK